MSHHGELRFNIVELSKNVTNITSQNIPNDARITFASGFASLTKETCKKLAGSGMSRYEGSAIWTRATTWKFPLFQVFALFPRPPLNLKTEIFVLTHLLGDPIDSVQNLLLKISRCQSQVKGWKSYLKDLDISIDLPLGYGRDELARTREERQIKERRWKSLSLVTDAYDEWGRADRQVLLMDILLKSSEDKTAFLKTIFNTSDALAADRATKYLPAIIALISFVAIIAIAMARTAAAIGSPSFNTSIFISIEVHSITFSSLYFWILPALLFASCIGVSQTEARIPRILDRFHEDIHKHFSNPTAHANLSEIEERVEELKTLKAEGIDHRMFHGGIYSWQPLAGHFDTPHWASIAQHRRDASDGSQAATSLMMNSPRDPSSNNPGPRAATSTQINATHAMTQTAQLIPKVPRTNSTGVTARLSHHLKSRLFPTLIILIPTISGAVVSSRVPPDGWNCRVSGEVAIFFAWLASAELGTLIQRFIPSTTANQKSLFKIMLVKDLFFALGTIVWVFMTVVGALNRCDCWIDHDGSLILPQREDIDRKLQRRLQWDYPAWIFSGVAVELILIPAWVKYRHGGALKVFVQRDDGTSNIEWFWDVCYWIVRKCSKAKQRTNSGYHLTNTTPRGN